MQNESDFVRLRDNRREGHSLRGKAYKSGLNGIKKVGREGCLTKTGSKAASSLTIPGQLTSSTREAISAESTHETKTTTHVLEYIIFTSDNANLLDI
ncbi:hypothetical protein, partial [Maricaulis sp.]|uniref:hypothetical protein n=1 Tax=Maricaulis sp. TaxID=1486257 RepID=UPI00261A121A